MAGRLRSPPLPAGGRGVRVPRRKLRGCALSGTTDRREQGRREGVFAPNGKRGWTRGPRPQLPDAVRPAPPPPTPRGGAQRFRVTNTSISTAFGDVGRSRPTDTHLTGPWLGSATCAIPNTPPASKGSQVLGSPRAPPRG
ncbi:unnamed protein product [Rangifer tarandus platyrhynchus]|uniref:Uncharacterized protein n=2 Tax=Rangifer tarandus platyrhynchus TaxID=3082113 RepID=A0ABN8Z504_RANTA|nr:unnamed protein product [Rangifer tarandus platyrhynchus]CAI9704755.1 unnamed protein product [Rangifer tarandus platyrhynchus]